MSAATASFDRLMDDTMKDPAMADRLRADPESVLDDYDLTEDERKMVEEADQNGIRYLMKDGQDATTASYCRLQECTTK